MKNGLSINDVFLSVGSVSIPVTYSINDFTELNSGTGDYSTDFTIPATFETRSVLGFATDLNSTTRTPYKRQNATLIVGSYEVYGFIQIVDFDRRANEITLSFFSGNSEWFALADEISIKDLGFTAWNHIYSVDNVVLNRNQSEGYCYPLIDYGTSLDNPYNTIELGQIFPATYYSEIIKAGFRAIGYKASYPSLLIDQVFSRAVIPYSGKGAPKHLRSFRDRLFASASYSGSGSAITTPTLIDIDFNPTTTSENLQSSDVVYTFRNAGKARALFEFSGNYEGAFTFIVYKNTDVVASRLYISDDDGAVINNVIDIETEGNENDTISIKYFVEPSGSVTLANYNVLGTVGFTFLGDIFEGSEIELGAFLPDITFAEFMTLLSKQFNLLFQANQVTQSINVFKFRDVLDNVSNAIDWSSKLHRGSQSFQDFERITQNLGRSNSFSYAEAGDDELLDSYFESNLVTYGSGIVTLDNDFISDSNDYVTLDFAPTINRYSWANTFYVPSIPLVDLDGKEVNPEFRCLLVNVNTLLSDFSTGETELQITGLSSGGTVTTMPFAWFWKEPLNTDLDLLRFSLAFGIPFGSLSVDRNLIDTYYETFPNLFTRPILLSVEAFLTAVDVNGLDFSKPIYLNRPYNGYFFLNRVVEYIGQDSPCTLELLKIA